MVCRDTRRIDPVYGRPFVLLEVKIDALEVEWTSIRALIDTGARHTSVHGDTALATLGIPEDQLAASSWPDSERQSLDGVGGSVPYRRLAAAFRFSHETGAQQVVDGSIHIGPHPHESQTLPSLMGMDLLQDFRLTLDGPEGGVTLE